MKEDFVFPDIDEVGIETLEAVSIAVNFNEWMYKTINAHCNGKILEIGSGIGNISKHFIENGQDITLTDIRENYVTSLKEQFPSHENKTILMDLVDLDFDTKYRQFLGTYDTVFALNVVEHIKDDQLAIINAKKLLKPNGKLIILVPAFQFLYNSFDTALEHFRRYTKKSLNKLISSELELSHSQYFNAFGMLGWFVSGRVLKKKTIPIKQMKIYDKLLFVAKTIDICLLNQIGLSVISIGTKK
ncbi:class I SAM-dependent methyltransferase [Saprospiraceae bacterium]|nr:class I SAM-dependent methyltransferase [Saprospiraceae bacterium]